MTTEEKKIARSIEASGKGCIVLLNKWDLVSGIRMEHALRGLEEEIPFLAHSPKLFISAKSGRNVRKIMPLVDTVLASMNKRVQTHALNKALALWSRQYQPPFIGGKRLRIYYMSQVDVAPPRFVLFVNDAALLDNGYKRYLINNLRETFQFAGVPFLLFAKGKQSTRKPNPARPEQYAGNEPDPDEEEEL